MKFWYALALMFMTIMTAIADGVPAARVYAAAVFVCLCVIDCTRPTK